MQNSPSKLQLIDIEGMYPKVDTVRGWVMLAMQNSCYDVEMTCVNQRQMASLNGRFRDKFQPTNILSFPDENVSGAIQGSLVFCPQVLENEARESNITLESHWAHLVIHGVLHLRGYVHDTPSKQAVMEALEVQLLQELGYTNPYG